MDVMIRGKRGHVHSLCNFFPKNHKGLSVIVITLILILLSLVAIGVVWFVVNNLIKSGTEGAEFTAKCLNIDVEATVVSCTGGTCDVTFTRTGTEDDEIGGVKLVFRDSTNDESSAVIDEEDYDDLGGNIEALAGKKVTDIDTDLDAPDRIEVTVYFEDESGNEKLCQQSTSFTW
jgi:hypothetical protein